MNTPESVRIARERVLYSRLYISSLKILNAREDGFMHITDLERCVYDSLDFDDWEYGQSVIAKWKTTLSDCINDMAALGFVTLTDNTLSITEQGRHEAQNIN